MEGMTRELFDAIGEQAVKAAGPHAPTITPFDRRSNRIVTTPGGGTETLKADPPARAHAAFDIDSLVKLIGQLASDEAGGNVPVVWANRSRIVAVFNDGGYRDEQATVALALSPQMLLLMELERTGKQFTQRELLTLLRIKLKDCGLPDNLVDLLRRVQFKIATDGASDVQRAKVSVGKQHMAELCGLDSLPEWLTIRVPVWVSVFTEIATIPVALDPDPETQTFRLIPQLGKIEEKIQAAEKAMVASLQEQMPDGVPVYFGQP